MRKVFRAAIAAVVITLAAAGAGDAGAAAAAARAGQASLHVAVIPGFKAPVYENSFGLPLFPSTAPELSAYRFTELGPSSVTASALSRFDTIVVYGQRWNDLPGSARTAINGFARTGKVVIWDADSTGSQSYSSFVHPFSTLASGEQGAKAGAVVSFPGGEDPLASSDPASPLYLDPAALVANTHLVSHMNVMQADAGGWAAALRAANQQIPNGGWLLAWGYGVTGDHSGMVIYSGMDADAFHDTVTPNYALKELAIELATPFLRTADGSCAPSCSPPPATGGGSGGTGGTGGGGTGGGGSGGGSGGSTGGGTFAQCSFIGALPKAWVRGRVALRLKTSDAANVGARPETVSGKALGALVPTVRGRLTLRVNTRLLPSNRRSPLLAVVYAGTERACAAKAHLRVDNVAPRLLSLRVRASGGATSLRIRVSERVRLALTGAGWAKRLRLPARRTVTVALPAGTSRLVLVVRDRAGNRATRRLKV